MMFVNESFVLLFQNVCVTIMLIVVTTTKPLIMVSVTTVTITPQGCFVNVVVKSFIAI